MPAYYIYLVSSLPMLHWGKTTALTFEKFLRLSAEFIPESDLAVLRTVSISGADEHQNARYSTLKKWSQFDTALRNELVRIRVARKHLDEQRYLRQDGFAEPFVARIAMSAYRSPSILEAERMLDEARWSALEGFCVGHFFDLDFLIVYALKLLLLERWEKIKAADKEHLLQEALKIS